jgi:hypothetical protein
LEEKGGLGGGLKKYASFRERLDKRFDKGYNIIANYIT